MTHVQSVWPGSSLEISPTRLSSFKKNFNCKDMMIPVVMSLHQSTTRTALYATSVIMTV